MSAERERKEKNNRGENKTDFTFNYQGFIVGLETNIFKVNFLQLFTAGKSLTADEYFMRQRFKNTELSL